MLHLAGLTDDHRTLEMLLACITTADTLVLYPESAHLRDTLAAKLPGGVALFTLGEDINEAQLAERVAGEPTLTWFDND